MTETVPRLTLAGKLAAVTKAVRAVAERGTNPTFRYRYATAGDLIDEVRGKLAERNVALMPSVERVDRIPLGVKGGEIRTTSRGAAIVLTRVRMAFIFIDGDSDQRIELCFEGEGADEGDKGLNKAYTACLKYFLRQAFLIPVGDDAEADPAVDTSADASASTPVNRNGVSADAPRQTEPLASPKQRGLIMGKASDAALDSVQLATALLLAARQPLIPFDDVDAATSFVQRNLDRLPARLVDPVLEQIAVSNGTSAVTA